MHVDSTGAVTGGLKPLSGFDAVGRREFLKLLGASLALSGCACRPAPHLARWAGPSAVHATCLEVDGVGVPLQVTTRDGRPVKVDGHPTHPATRGASGLREQAELLRLYDPHRAAHFKRRGKSSRRQAFLDEVLPKVRALSERDGGRGVRFLCPPTSSPHLVALKARLLRLLPNARFVVWSPCGPQSRHEGAKLAFGRPFEPLYDFSKAKVIASFDDDFLSPHGPKLAYARGWAERRNRERGEMNRLYVVEPALTVTGAAADHRLAARGSEVESMLRAVLFAVAQMREALRPVAVHDIPLDSARARWVTALARDLVAAGKEALVTVSDRQPPAVHALAHALSVELGSLGHCVHLIPPGRELEGGPVSLKLLADELDQGQVDLLVVTAGNPAYAGFADVGTSALLKAVPLIYLSAYEDETAALSEWFVPKLTALETWGDARALDGSVLLQQPLVEPLLPEAWSEAELYAALCGEPTSSAANLLKQTWTERLNVDAEDGPAQSALTESFERWVREGSMPGTTFTPQTAALDLNAVARAPVGKPVAGMELCFVPDTKLHAGELANCTWLQELPDPITGLSWDNAVLLGPATAQKLGVGSATESDAARGRTSQLLKLTVTSRGASASVVAPALVVPGHAEGSLTLPLGYGRESRAEAWAHGVGVSAFRLRMSDAAHFCSVEAAKADGEQTLACVQLTASPGPAPSARPVPGAQSVPARPSPKEEPLAVGGLERWGMAVDLNRCTGCGACVLACQAENNIPVVGKNNLLRHREMSWIRIDRYFPPQAHALEAIPSQPVMCQHCEKAPCEPVCPVGATTHSTEGLNTVHTSRCVGARACSAHCPYGVRRFNFFNYREGAAGRSPFNPQVPTRPRGVVEKCTFCSHRIDAARAEAGGARLRRPPSTACQDVCPSQAIVFGDLSDAGSPVRAWAHDSRAQRLLEALGTSPRVSYLARVQNANPELA